MENPELCPESIQQFLCRTASAYPKIKQILLFGSRARRDATKRSDFDFAVIAPDIDPAQWLRFNSDIKDHSPTLCAIDLVLLNPQTAPDLRARIGEEGVTVYERLSA